MAKIINQISLLIARTFAIREVDACSQNADYKLVVVDKETQNCESYYFYSLREAVEFASPPNFFYGDGKDYVVYHRRSDSKETFIKLNDTTNKFKNYECNAIRSIDTWKQDQQTLLFR